MDYKRMREIPGEVAFWVIGTLFFGCLISVLIMFLIVIWTSILHGPTSIQ